MWWEIEGHLDIVDGRLKIAGKDAEDMYRKVNEPVYVYNLKRVEENFRRVLNAFSDSRMKIRYAMKANSDTHVLTALRENNAWIDAVSCNEVKKALSAGYEPQQIMYTGIGTTDEEFEYLLKSGVSINIDNTDELDIISFYCNKLSISKKNAIKSIRWNPGEGAGFSAKTITAGKEAHGIPIKFGVPEDQIIEAYEKAVELGFEPNCLHQHIGSNWHGEDVDDFLNTVYKTLEKTQEINKNVKNIIREVDFGGGPGIRYKEEQKEFPLKKYANGIKNIVNEFPFIEYYSIEPGRYIVGDAGVLLAEITSIKNNYGNIIAIANTGFHHLLRPTMYAEHKNENGKEITEECYHEIVICRKANWEPKFVVTIGGNLCETGDVLAIKRPMPKIEKGDVIAILNAGAYGYEMAPHNYNSRGSPKKIILG